MFNYSAGNAPIETIVPEFTAADVANAILGYQQKIEQLERSYSLGGQNYLDYHKSTELNHAKLMLFILQSK